MADPPSQVQSALDTGIPTHLSYGFVSGFCSGMALKKVGRAVSVVLGRAMLFSMSRVIGSLRSLTHSSRILRLQTLLLLSYDQDWALYLFKH